MGTAAASIDDVISTFPELAVKGPTSAGVLTVTVQAQSGDTLTFADADGECVLLTLVAGTDFTIGADEAATATNIAAAIDADARFTACANGAIVYFDTVATGPASLYTLSSSAPSRLTFSGSPMTGGDTLAQFAVTKAATEFTLAFWGARRSYATTLAAAHVIASLASSSTGGASAGGVVASRTIDKLSISYATGPILDGDLGSTRYGILLKSTIDNSFALPIVGAYPTPTLPIC